MAQTSSYGLRQWEIHEGIHREELNQAMAGIDSALAGAVAGATSTLTGSINEVRTNLTSSIAAVNGALADTAAGLEGSITELQGDLAALEKAQASKAEYLTGTFTGNGASSRVISLGRTPKAVLLENKEGERFWDGLCRMGGLALTSLPFGNNDTHYMAIQTGGFTVSAVSTNYGTNANGFTYYYLALL